jgi:hypothetical protein
VTSRIGVVTADATPLPDYAIVNAAKRILRQVAQYADLFNSWLECRWGQPDAILVPRTAIDAACSTFRRDPSTLVRAASI